MTSKMSCCGFVLNKKNVHVYPTVAKTFVSKKQTQTCNFKIKNIINITIDFEENKIN